jgi:maleylacetate reductase
MRSLGAGFLIPLHPWCRPFGGAPDRDASEAFAAFIGELGLPRWLAEVGVAEDRFELIGKNAMFPFSRARTRNRSASPGDVVQILKMAA